MSKPQIFTVFSELPSEVRLLIWSQSLEARVLHMKCEIFGFSPQDAPEFLYLLGGDPPYTHFTAGTALRPNEPYYTGHLYPFRVSSPAALSVSHEAREVALTAGYKAWNVNHPVWGHRRIMWNPKVDVLLFQKHALLWEHTILDLFLKQFPGQAKAVERIAMWSSLWPFWNRANISPLVTPLEFKALEELIVVVDRKMEKDCSEQIMELRFGENSEADAWVVPQAIIDALEVVKRDYLVSNSKRKRLLAENWTPPRVRVVLNENRILTEDCEDLKLRCFPCKYLDRVPSPVPRSLVFKSWELPGR